MAESPADEPTYRPQAVDYLGFLEAQLRDLQGIAAMTYELIQNADDIKDEAGQPANQLIAFDVREDALIVENQGVFRPVDFERLQRIASGDKRDELGTTGAFGIGFLSVYQVTDYPEIFSSGCHWTIRADAQPEKRIEERQLPTEATRFRLPWAFDTGSPIRRRLRLDTIAPNQLDDLAWEIGQAMELSALFLRQLHSLELRRQGRLVKRLHRSQPVAGQLQLQDESGRAQTWHLLQGTFDAQAAQLRASYPWQIETGRHSQVWLALPAAGLDQPGRLFAALPSETTIPLPLHINADFFPTTDRKRIPFQDGYQAEWNQAAMRAAASILAANLEELPRLLGPQVLWQLLQRLEQANRMADQGELPTVLAAFWQAAAPGLHRLPLVYRIDGRWRKPGEVRLAQGKSAQAAWPILRDLDLPLVHPDLDSYAPLMQRPEIGVPALNLADLVVALRQAGFNQPQPLAAAPAGLDHLEAWRLLYRLIDRLMPLPGGPGQAAWQELHHLCIVLTQAGRLERLDRVYRGREEAQRLFPQLAWLHHALANDPFPGKAVVEFGVRQAVDVLADMPPDALETAWQTGRLDLPAIFRWFENQAIEIFSDDPTLPQHILRLPLCPVSGELHPLRDLFLPGDFDDPLNLSSMVDLEAIGGRPHFLADLGVTRLDFDTYLRQILPQVLRQQPDLPSDARHQLVQLLSDRLGQIRDDEQLQQQLSLLPLIPCLDGHFRPASQVYASRQVIDILGPAAHIAEPVSGAAQAALHHWLGVAEQPRPADLLRRIQQLSQQPPREAVRVQMGQLLAHLTERWPQLSPGDRGQLEPLRRLPWLPAQGDAGQWHLPDQLYTRDQAPLIASQARFLDAGQELQQLAAGPDGLFHFLGLPLEPAAAMVASHLAACSRQRLPPDERVYQFLDKHAAAPALDSLRQEASIYLPSRRFARPDQVYWQPHPFGSLRHQLPPEFDRFQRLFRRLGVRQQPQTWDYIQVLREIGQRAGLDQEPQPSNIIDVARACWRHLGELLDRDELSPAELSSLQGVAAVPDTQGALRSGQELLLNDEPVLAGKFQGLAPHLLAAQDPGRPALLVVGVRLLTQAVRVELVDSPAMQPDPVLAQRLLERRPLLARVLAAAPGAPAAGWSLDQVTSLPIYQVSALRLRFHLQLGAQQLASAVETASAKIAGEPPALYIAGEPDRYPWPALARELANALRPGGQNSGLASGIKEALTGPTFEEAQHNLDDLGYPRLSG